jgi:hypothetical protein
MLSATLGSLLIIISSGLYTVDVVPVSHNITTQTTDQLNIAEDVWWERPSAKLGAMMYDLVEQQNGSYPRGTF